MALQWSYVNVKQSTGSNAANVIVSVEQNAVLSTATIIVSVVVSIATYFLFKRNPLSPIPGPFLAHLSPIWLICHARKGDMHRCSIDLHKKHGRLVRTGPNEVSVSDLAAIKKIYAPGTKFRKSDWYSVWQGHRKFDLFGERNEQVHAAQRKLVSSIYSMESLKDLEPYVDDAVAAFLSKLSKLQEQPINMALWAQLFAFDVVGEVTFSKRFGFMDAGQDDGSFAQIDNALRSAAWVGQVPWLYWLHDWISPYIGNRLGITARHGSLRSFAAKEVDARKTRGSDHRDILEKLFEVHRDKPEEMNDMAVLSMATSNVFAGSDTTAISIGSVLYHLCCNRQAKDKLMEEIVATQKDGQIGKTVAMDVARAMPYLQACLYEALRLFPAVGMTLPRVTPPEGIEIDGRFIPGGTVVGANPWVVHQDKDVFGEDVTAFRPERWIESDSSEMHRFFFAFGAGARVCLGKNLGWLEMSKLIPLLLLNFDIELADPRVALGEKAWWFVKQEGLIMKVRART